MLEKKKKKKDKKKKLNAVSFKTSVILSDI